jgi:predicted ester cyclase
LIAALKHDVCQIIYKRTWLYAKQLNQRKFFMLLEENKAIIHRLYDQINKGNVDVINELIAPDFVSYGAAGFPDIRGIDAFKQFFESFLNAFPDLSFGVDLILAEGDLVMARGPLSGTHTGNFMGIAPPTHKRITWSGTAIFHIVNGKATERWQDWDGLGFMQQMGVLPEVGLVAG